jgi:DNA-binding HxlR family transcriptional regulator
MIHNDHKRFNQFLEIEDINAKVLSARLKEMQKDGLIESERFTPTLLSELNTSLLKRGGHLSQYLIKCPHFL